MDYCLLIEKGFFMIIPNLRCRCFMWFPTLPQQWRCCLQRRLAGHTQWAVYISGVRSSGHRVKPDMAAMEALSYVGFSPPTLSFMFTCYVKTAQGDWNRRKASLFAQSVTGRSHSIYIWSSLVIPWIIKTG